MYQCIHLVLTIVFWTVCRITFAIETPPLRGPPIVETNLNLLDSYLPASMQIIAHLTDLMKYDLRPESTKPTSTTFRPTRPHSPGLFAPNKPPGPESYFSRGTSYEEYVQILQNPEGQSYFDKYKYPVEELDDEKEEMVSRMNGARARTGLEATLDTTTKKIDEVVEDIPEGLDALLGPNTWEVLKLANRLEEDDGNEDDVQRARAFEHKYDDDIQFRQKRVPPTKAYVTLLSLYDHLNKESKKMGLSKYQGYTKKVLEDLVDTSSGTSSNQLKFVLDKVVEKRDIRQENVVMKIKSLLKDLEQSDSYINNALRYIPPLRFSP